MMSLHIRARAFFSIVACVLSIQSAGISQAAAINYGDFSDIPPGSVMYPAVTESSFSDPVPLYGAPTIIGDMLDFDPFGFGATGSGSIPYTDVTDGQLNFSMTTSGPGIAGLTLFESGDYRFTGSGTTTTSVGAAASISVEITHINGNALLNYINVFASASVDYNIVSNPPSGLQQWTLLFNINFANALIQAGYNPQVDLVTGADVAIDNQLSALSETTSTSIIAKKNFQVTTTYVPEPTSLALLACGAAMIFRRNRH